VAEKHKKTPKKTSTKTSKKTGKTVKKRTPPVRLRAVDIRHFRDMLLEKRRELLQNVFEIEGETLRKSRLDASGDLSSMPIHMADLGTDNYEQEFSLGLMDGERRLLVEIDEALARVEDKTYGICEGTGKPIAKARLEAQPWARYSIEYARMLEEGRLEQGE